MSEKIHPIHLFFIVHMTQTGLILMSLPRITAETFGTNGWLSIPMISLVVLLQIALLDVIYRWSKGSSVYTLLEALLPKALYWALYLLLTLFWAGVAFIIAKRYAFVVKFLFYPLTSVHWLMMIMTFLAYYIVTSGIYTIGKVVTILFFLASWMILVFPFYIPDFQWVRLTSHFFQGNVDFLRGSIEIYTAFLGFELILFLFPYIDKKDKKAAHPMKYVYLGHVYTTFVYLFITLICYGFFSFPQLMNQVYPVITLLKYLELSFVQRLDGLIFFVFLLKIIISVTMYLWVSLETAKRLNLPVHSHLLAFSLCAIGFFSTYPLSTRFAIEEWLYLLSRVQILISFALPLLLFIYLLWKRRRANA